MQQLLQPIQVGRQAGMMEFGLQRAEFIEQVGWRGCFHLLLFSPFKGGAGQHKAGYRPESTYESRAAMSHHLVTLKLSADDHAEIDAALARIEDILPDVGGPSVAVRRSQGGAEDHAAVLCRQALALLARNPRMVPLGPDMTDVQHGLQQLEQLRLQAQRLRTVLERMDDALLALGSDVMHRASARDIALCTITGKGSPLSALRQGVVTHITDPQRAANELPRLRPVPTQVDAG